MLRVYSFFILFVFISFLLGCSKTYEMMPGAYKIVGDKVLITEGAYIDQDVPANLKEGMAYSQKYKQGNL